MITIPGIFAEVFGQGVLIKGKSGAGKSLLALELIDRGHCLIADDAVFFKKQDKKLVGFCSAVIQDFLYIPEFGIINVPKTFSASAVCLEAELQLMISLNAKVKEKPKDLSGNYETTTILDVDIPTLTMPSNHRNIAIIIETSIRDLMLKKEGYSALEAFEARQKQFMNANAIKLP
jgi:HPr kinase/phosphorylase